MKADLAFPVAGLSGTDRGQPERNWYSYRGQQIVRRPPVGAATNTKGQSFARRYLIQAGETWGTLSASRRASWEVWARVWNESAGEGAVVLDGRAAWMMRRWYRNTSLLPNWLDPPAVKPLYAITGVSAVVKGPFGQWAITMTSNQPVGRTSYVYQMVSRGFGTAARVARKTDMRSVGELGSSDPVREVTGPGPVTTTATNAVLEVEIGEWVWVWLRFFSSDLWPGVERRFQVVVT